MISSKILKNLTVVWVPLTIWVKNQHCKIKKIPEKPKCMLKS